ncbi:MAG: hypothetical protein V4537_03425 [Pseudomonadota bacterium]
MLERPRPTANDTTPLTAEQVFTAINEFDEAHWRKIRSAAHFYSKRSGLDPEDLVQEACCRILRLSRKVNGDKNALWTLIGTMRSLASNEIEAREGGLRPELQSPEEMDGYKSSDLGPEYLVFSRIDDGRTLTVILNALSKDPALAMLVEALADGLFGKHLEQQLNLDSTGLAALRTKLKRRLKTLQPLIRR